MNAFAVLAQATGGWVTVFITVVALIVCSRVIPVVGALALLVTHLIRERPHGSRTRAPSPTR